MLVTFFWRPWGLQYAAADLGQFDRLQQRLEMLAIEAIVALALDEIEEDKPELVLSEVLQQHVLLTDDEYLALAQLVHRGVQVVRAYGDVLDALVPVHVQGSWIWPGPCPLR